VISNDQNNQSASTITVLPVTSKTSRVYPFEVSISKKDSGLAEDSKIKANQVRTVDKARLGKLIGFISPEIMAVTEEALLLHLGIGSAAVR